MPAAVHTAATVHATRETATAHTATAHAATACAAVDVLPAHAVKGVRIVMIEVRGVKTSGAYGLMHVDRTTIYVHMREARTMQVVVGVIVTVQHGIMTIPAAKEPVGVVKRRKPYHHHASTGTIVKPGLIIER